MKFVTSEYAASMIGTSANLCKGDIVTVYDLLCGLMLPSGNDAATVLAQGFVIKFIIIIHSN